MAKEVSKERLLALLKIMFENTDDEQGLTLEQILEELEAAGVSAERKALYRDFEALNNAGIEIQRQHVKPVRYFLAKRPFTKSELLLLIDALHHGAAIGFPGSLHQKPGFEAPGERPGKARARGRAREKPKR